MRRQARLFAARTGSMAIRRVLYFGESSPRFTESNPLIFSPYKRLAPRPIRRLD